MAMYIVAFLLGLLAGRMLLLASTMAIRKRTDDIPDCLWINGKGAPILWMLVNAGVWLGIYLGYGTSAYSLELLFACSACMIISAVDFCIRMIPNQVLLALVVGAITCMFLEKSWGNAWNRLLGCVLGAGVFLLPFLIGQQAGAGDIKFAAVMGLYLGFYNTVIALFIMSIFILLYASVQLLTRKGNLKSIVALGPYMSAGFIATLAFLENSRYL